ncbi:MAG: antibiotic biosynthesis monooxygenase [Candidatus Hydrothermales bacterium]
MFVAINRIFVKREFRKDFEERFKNRKRLVEKQEGFIRIEILRPLQGEDYLVITYWKTEEDFLRWVNSEDFKKAHQDSPPSYIFSRPNEFSAYEVVEF